MIATFLAYYRRKVVLPGYGLRLLVAPGEDPQTAMEVFSRWKANRNAEHGSAKKRELVRSRFLEAGERRYVAKVYKPPVLRRGLMHSLFFSDARRNFATMVYLRGNGVPVTRPLALLSGYRFSLRSSSVLFVQQLPESYVDYKKLLHTFVDRPLAERIAFFRQLGASLAHIHACGVYTEDMDKNTMVEQEMGSDFFRFVYFDFDNFFPWRFPTLRRSGNAIKKFCYHREVHAFHAEEINALVTSYCRSRSKPKWVTPIFSVIRRKWPRVFGNVVFAGEQRPSDPIEMEETP